MKAVITKAYGDVDVLSLEEVDKPSINENELLIEIKAVSINPLDFRVRSGELKMMTGKVAPHILGSDYAGVVKEIGSNITEYKVNDEVFGLLNGMKNKEGTYAEFVKVNIYEISLKPTNLTFEESASLPMITSTAYNALINIANIQKDNTILVHGATGGVGMASVQLASALGAKVTSVSSSKNFNFAKELGASKCLDYKTDDISAINEKFDIVFDVSGKFTFNQAEKILKTNGIYITTNATISAVLLTPIQNLFRKKKSKIVMTQPDRSVLKKVKNIIEKEQVKPFIHQTFTLETIKDAHKLAQKGGFTGKLTVNI